MDGEYPIFFRVPCECRIAILPANSRRDHDNLCLVSPLQSHPTQNGRLVLSLTSQYSAPNAIPPRCPRCPTRVSSALSFHFDNSGATHLYSPATHLSAHKHCTQQTPQTQSSYTSAPAAPPSLASHRPQWIEYEVEPLTIGNTHIVPLGNVTANAAPIPNTLPLAPT